MHELEITELKCSCRLKNILIREAKSLGMSTHWFQLKELSNISIEKFTQCRGVGQKTLNELKEICNSLNIHLKP